MTAVTPIYPIKKCVSRQSNFGMVCSYAVSGLVVVVLVTVAGAQLARVVISLLVTLEKRQLGGKVRALESGLGCV